MAVLDTLRTATHGMACRAHEIGGMANAYRDEADPQAARTMVDTAILREIDHLEATIQQTLIETKKLKP